VATHVTQASMKYVGYSEGIVRFLNFLLQFIKIKLSRNVLLCTGSSTAC